MNDLSSKFDLQKIPIYFGDEGRLKLFSSNFITFFNKSLFKYVFDAVICLCEWYYLFNS